MSPSPSSIVSNSIVVIVVKQTVSESIIITVVVGRVESVPSMNAVSPTPVVKTMCGSKKRIVEAPIISPKGIVKLSVRI